MFTNNNKVDHFAAQMYAGGLFGAKFLDDWEEIFDKSWGETQPCFTKHFNKELRKLELDNAQK